MSTRFSSTSMPSRRSKSRGERRRALAGRWLVCALIAATVWSCGGPRRPVADPEAGFRREPLLVAPTSGYDVALDSEAARALDRAHQLLMRGGSTSEARASADRWRGSEGAEPPAAVLTAQADFFDERCDLALDRLAPIVEAFDGYLAARLALGRCAETTGDLAVAAASYRAVSDRSALARSRWETIAPEASRVAAEQIRTLFEAGDAEGAGRELSQLQQWAPDDDDTLHLISDLAATLGDRPLELRLVRALASRGDPERPLRERQAELELAVGDAGAGMKILEDLLREWPADEQLNRRLEEARFDWRLTLLPAAARGLDRPSQIDRSELAVLVYWVFPTVRYQRPSDAVIANDVFDHAHRAEIVRVVNLGLMDIDPNLHAFRPGSEATREDGLTTMLRVLARADASPACLGAVAVEDELDTGTVCKLSASCGLLEEPGECLPSAPLSGRAAMDLARRVSQELETG